MAYVIWPLSLPQETFKDGYSRSMPDMTIRSDMEIGPAKVRYRGGHKPEVLTITLVLTDDQVEVLRTFVYDTLMGGAVAFEFPKPEDNSVYILARFIPLGNGEMYRVTQYERSIKWKIDIKLEVWRDITF